ncbi:MULTISPECIES: tripartite tricarboxylate transporter TctB family protein [Marinobacter]|uniref:tripartite tricarboxylate transporter TctB family protein n=1 Tax=Marinobacter TaxID=2742 RepID=UPI000DAC20CD|nr:MULTISPECIES: tripartite tricarboxylate transporter TctB family protein [Marinobacter]
MSRSVGEAVFTAVLMGFAGFALYEAFGIRGSAAGGSLAPAFFPKAICTLLLIFLGVSLFRTLLKVRHEAKPDEGGDTRGAVLGWLIVLAELVVYSLVLEPLGYVISTALLIVAVVATLMLLSAGERQRITPRSAGMLVGFSAVVSVAIFLLFSKGFGLVLPTLGAMGV